MANTSDLREFRSLGYKVTDNIQKRLETIKNCELQADKVLIVGDMHLDSSYKGSHVDYKANCKRVMEELLVRVINGQYDTIIFAGDFLGVRKGVATLKEREFFIEVVDWLKGFWELGCVPMSIRGNHDNYQPNDFELLVRLGYLIDLGQVPNYNFELTSSLGKVTDAFRLHFVPYGIEQRDLELKKFASNTNIVLAHHNFYVAGREEFFVTEGAIDVPKHKPFYGADLVLSGDIHAPSSTLIDYTDGSGMSSYFLNLGCATRPSYSERYDNVWLIELSHRKEGNEVIGEVKPIIWELVPADEVFKKSNTTQQALRELQGLSEDEVNELTERSRKLDLVLRNVNVVHTDSADYLRIIDKFTIVSDNAKVMAKKYIDKAVKESAN